MSGRDVNIKMQNSININRFLDKVNAMTGPLSLRERVRVRAEMTPKIPKHIIVRSRELRKNSTDAEQLLWRLLRNRQLAGAKFRRQYPVGKFILDFYCVDHRLAIELDGGQHSHPKNKAADIGRTKILAAKGITVLRFWNNEILANTEGVLEVIWKTLTPALSLRERG
jgi:very-short-patch-repair endonuclease